MSILWLIMASLILHSASDQPKLVLIRNGESEWKRLNLFIGWSDDPLSEKGRKEATRGGQLLKEEGYIFDVCYTSILNKAIHTAFHVLDELDQLNIPVYKGLKLNGRHYGALQGLKKREIKEKYGIEQYNLWRRSFDVAPPALDIEDVRNPANQLKYRNYPKETLPLHESLKDTNERIISYFKDVIFPDLQSGKTILISAHKYSIKAIVKYLDNISERDYFEIKIPSGVPLVYEFDKNFIPKKSYYLGNKEGLTAKLNDLKYLNSNTKIIIVDELNKEEEKGVWELCKSADYDFIPPLSDRVDTVHKFIGHNPSPEERHVDGPVKFFEVIKSETFLFIMTEEKIEGFMSFIPDYPLEINGRIIICEYITTIIIDSNSRNKGYTKKMYDVILSEKKDKNIATRTWSTNFAHMHILDNLGFELVQRDLNDRGPNIDTVYYLKTPNQN